VVSTGYARGRIEVTRGPKDWRDVRGHYYVALPFVAADDGIAAAEAVECFNPNAPVMRAEPRLCPVPPWARRVRRAAATRAGRMPWCSQQIPGALTASRWYAKPWISPVSRLLLQTRRGGGFSTKNRHPEQRVVGRCWTRILYKPPRTCPKVKSETGWDDSDVID
jgi:hypothetical protein